MHQIILEELNKIVQIDIYTNIEDNLLNVDIYIDKLYQDEIIEYVKNRIKDTFEISYQEISNHIYHLSCYCLLKELSNEYIHRIKENNNVYKDNIYFGQIDYYLSRLNVLIKKIFHYKYIYVLEFSNDIELKEAYKYLSKYYMKIDIKDNYFKYRSKTIKIIKEVNNKKDKDYFLYTNFVSEDL